MRFKFAPAAFIASTLLLVSSGWAAEFCMVDSAANGFNVTVDCHSN